MLTVRQANVISNFDNWIKQAFHFYVLNDLVEAELSAYEAGRYGIAMPEVLAPHALLRESFKRGAQDAVDDAQAEKRALDQDSRYEVQLSAYLENINGE